MIKMGGIIVKKHICMIISFVILCAMITVSLSEEISYQWAYQGEVALFEENEKIGLIDRNGNILHCADLDSVKPFDNNGLSEITKNGKIGMINTYGKVVIEPIFCSYMGYITVENGFTELHDETVAYQNMQQQWGFYSLEGDLISEAQWDDTYGFVNDIAYVKKNGLWNMLDKNGKLILDDWWDSIEIGRDGVATLWNSEKGISVNSQGQICETYKIDSDGNWNQITYDFQSVNPYEQIYDLKNQQCAYRINNLCGVMNSNREIVTEPVWNDISTFAPNDLLCVYKDGLLGWIDRNGNYVLELQWKTIYHVKDNRWLGQLKNGEKWILDDQGNMLNMIGDNLVYAIPHEDGYIEYATNDGYWGFFDSEGNILSKVVEDEIKQISLADYSEGWIQVELNEQSLALMYVDGTILYSENWTYISPFYNGYAIIGIDGYEGFVDTSGNLIHPAIWKECSAYSFMNGQLIARVTSYSNEEESYINESGQTICGTKMR